MLSFAAAFTLTGVCVCVRVVLIVRAETNRERKGGKIRIERKSNIVDQKQSASCVPRSNVTDDSSGLSEAIVNRQHACSVLWSHVLGLHGAGEGF